MINLSALISFPGLILLIVVAGDVAVFLAANYARRSSLKLSTYQRESLSAKIVDWLGPDSPSTLIDETLKALQSLYLPCYVGLAVGILCCSCIYFFLLISPLWPATCSFMAAISPLAVCFLGGIIGLGAGCLYALKRLGKAAISVRNEEKLLSRNLHDYRSSLFFWIPMMWVALICALSLIFPKSFVSPSWCLAEPFSLPWNPWFTCIPVAVIVFTLLTVELMLRLIAAVPSPLVPFSSPQTQHADDLIRAMSVGTLQSTSYTLLWILAFALPIDLPYAMVTFLAAPLVLAPGFQSSYVWGRLGGRLTDWPWKRKRAAASRE